ncbi:hypothetical protein O3P69_014732 [Scylla paramamosain]|uniref:Reverse transcriptase domain-containing protein n=1 Tax=Scylla paramamosain TaxID=85552 RepID=A0AAW0TXN3_SCYPA
MEGRGDAYAATPSPLSTVGLVSVLRDGLTSLADNFHSASPHQLSDILKMMAAVAEGTEEAATAEEETCGRSQLVFHCSPPSRRSASTRETGASQKVIPHRAAYSAGSMRGLSRDGRPALSGKASPGLGPHFRSATETHHGYLHYFQALRRPPPSSRTPPKYVQEMLPKGVVERATGKIFLSRLFPVPKKDSSRVRLVLDLSALNKFLKPQLFKMVTVAEVQITLQKGDWLASLDLKDAYWHVSIFSKLGRVVASVLAGAGVSVFMYLDDWLLYSPIREGTASSVAIVTKVLREMGFVIKKPKSPYTPSQQLKRLGIMWDTSTATLSLATDNALKTRKQVGRAYFSTTFSRRQWESLLGTLNFAVPSLLLYRLKHRRLTREVNLSVPIFPRDLQRDIPTQNSSTLAEEGRLGEVSSLTVTSDASDVG